MKRGWRTVIEITGRHIKLVRTLLRGNKRAVVAVAVVDITGLPDDVIVTRLREAVHPFGRQFKRDDLIAVIPRQEAIVNVLNLPSQHPEELKPMAELQAIKQLPYNLGEVAVDTVVLQELSDGSSQVMTVAVPMDIFTRYWNIYQQAGITPRQVTISSVGLCGCFGLLGSAGTVGCLVDIDTDVSEICISDGEKLLASRQIPVGTQDLGEEAAGDLMRQLELTLAGYRKDNPGLLVGGVQLLSRKVTAQDLAGDLHPTLHMTGHNILQAVPGLSMTAWPAAVLSGDVSISAVLGLGCHTQPMPFDLVPRVLRQDELSRGLMRDGVRSALLMLVGVAALLLALSLPTFEKSARVKELETEYRLVKGQAAEVDAKAERVRGLEQALSRRIAVPKIFKELYELIGQDIVLTGLNIDDRGVLSLEGFGLWSNSVASLQNSFGRLTFCEDVKLEFINKRQTRDGEVDQFKIVCQIKSGS